MLPAGTNMDKADISVQTEEDRLLWAVNKWLIAHPESKEADQGAAIGLYGTNLSV